MPRVPTSPSAGATVLNAVTGQPLARCPFLAPIGGAITLSNYSVTATATGAGTTGLNMGKWRGAQPGDWLVMVLLRTSDVGSAFSCPGWQSLDSIESATGNDIHLAVFLRHINDFGEITTDQIFTNDDATSINMVGVMFAVRGAPPLRAESAGTTPQTFPGGEPNTTTSNGSNDFTPAALSITPNGPHNLVIVAHGASMNNGVSGKTGGAPSGTTLIGSVEQTGTNFGAFLEVCAVTQTNPAASTTSAWTGSADDATSEWAQIAFTFRPNDQPTPPPGRFAPLMLPLAQEIDLSPASLAFGAQQLTVTPGASAIDLDPASFVFLGSQLTVTPGAAAIDLEPAIAQFVASQLATVPAAAAIDLEPAVLAFVASQLSPAGAAAAIDLEPAIVTFSASELATSGDQELDLEPGVLALAASELATLGAAVQADLAPAAFAFAAQQLSISAPVNVDLVPALLSFAGGVLVPTGGAVAINLEPAVVNFLAQQLSVSAPTEISLVPAVMNLVASELGAAGGPVEVALVAAEVDFVACVLAPAQHVVIVLGYSTAGSRAGERIAGTNAGVRTASTRIGETS